MRTEPLFPTAFVAGFAAGVLFAPDPLPALWTRATLYALIGVVGVAVGSSPDAFAVLRRARLRVVALPVAVLGGSVLGAIVLALAWPAIPLREGIAVAAGTGYYSVTSLIATEAAGEALGVVALLANLLREAFTLAAAPWLARWIGPTAPIASGGATAMDTTLPVITGSSGRDWAVPAVYSGAVLTAAVPVIVPLILG